MPTCSLPKPKILAKLPSVISVGIQIGGLARISRLGRKADSTTQRPGTHMMTISRNVVNQRAADCARFLSGRLGAVIAMVIGRPPYSGVRP